MAVYGPDGWYVNGPGGSIKVGEEDGTPTQEGMYLLYLNSLGVLLDSLKEKHPSPAKMDEYLKKFSSLFRRRLNGAQIASIEIDRIECRGLVEKVLSGFKETMSKKEFSELAKRNDEMLVLIG